MHMNASECSVTTTPETTKRPPPRPAPPPLPPAAPTHDQHVVDREAFDRDRPGNDRQALLRAAAVEREAAANDIERDTRGKTDRLERRSHRDVGADNNLVGATPRAAGRGDRGGEVSFSGDRLAV